MTPAQVRELNDSLRRGEVPAHLMAEWLALLVNQDAERAKAEIRETVARLRESHRRSWNRIQNEARHVRIANYMRFTAWTEPRHFNCRCAPAP